MILADTNVFIDFWNNPTEALIDLFSAEKIVVASVVKAGLLQGAHSDKQYELIKSNLSQYPYAYLSNDGWEEFCKILYKLRINGVNVPFQDALHSSNCT